MDKEQAPEFNGWYCAHCQRGVDGSEVTFREQHTVCGRVITDDVPPAPQAMTQAEPVAVSDAMRELVKVRDWVAKRTGQLEKLKDTGQSHTMIEKGETLDMLNWAIERTALASAQPIAIDMIFNATDEMIDAALEVDWSNEDERGTAHNVWNAMCGAMPSQPIANNVARNVLIDDLYILAMNEGCMEEAIDHFKGSSLGQELKAVLSAQKSLRRALLAQSAAVVPSQPAEAVKLNMYRLVSRRVGTAEWRHEGRVWSEGMPTPREIELYTTPCGGTEYKFQYGFAAPVESDAKPTAQNAEKPCSECGTAGCNGECAGDDMMGSSS